MSTYLETQRAAAEVGILLDSCGENPRYRDFGTYIDLCGMTPTDAKNTTSISAMLSNGGNGGSNTIIQGGDLNVKLPKLDVNIPEITVKLDPSSLDVKITEIPDVNVNVPDVNVNISGTPDVNLVMNETPTLNIEGTINVSGCTCNGGGGNTVIETEKTENVVYFFTDKGDDGNYYVLLDPTSMPVEDTIVKFSIYGETYTATLKSGSEETVNTNIILEDPASINDITNVVFETYDDVYNYTYKIDPFNGESEFGTVYYGIVYKKQGNDLSQITSEDIQKMFSENLSNGTFKTKDVVIPAEMTVEEYDRIPDEDIDRIEEELDKSFVILIQNNLLDKYNFTAIDATTNVDMTNKFVKGDYDFVIRNKRYTALVCEGELKNYAAYFEDVTVSPIIFRFTK